MGSSKDHDYVYKVVLIGDAGVGKSNMLSRFSRNEFKRKYEPTIGFEFQMPRICVDDKIIKGQLWDTAGEERYQAVMNAYYRGAMGAIIVYDITRTVTFENVEQWLRQLRDLADQNIVVMLVGNKADLRDSQSVLTDEAKAFSQREDILFMETSAFEPLNIENAFIEVVTHIYRNALRPFPPMPPPQQEPRIETSAMLGAPVQLTPPPPPQPERRQGRKRDREDTMIDYIEWICEQQIIMMTHLGLHITRPLPPSIRDNDFSIKDTDSNSL